MFECSTLYKVSDWFFPNEKEDEKENVVPNSSLQYTSLSHTNTHMHHQRNVDKKFITYRIKSWEILCLKTVFRKLWNKFKRSVAGGCMISNVDFFSVNRIKKSRPGCLSL